MFPISSDGVFEDASIDKFLEDLLADCPISNGTETEKCVRKRPRKAEENNNGGSSESKKSAHRSIEKQRRQEMAALYASLRSLLPLEYIKGKRAVSDHMHQATIYINGMKKKIAELKARRNSFDVTSAAETSSESTNASPYCVKINLFTDELEILISSSIDKECFPLSMVLADLLERQLNVVNCVSTRHDRCSLHKIQVQLNDSASIDVSELQEGLLNVLKLA